MTENLKNSDNAEDKEENFAALLDAYGPGLKTEVSIGDKIHGKIVSIGRDSVFIDTGTKIDGVVDKAELLDENQQLIVEEGDILDLYVVAVTEDEIRLSKALSGIGGCFHVEILQRKAFCPISQVDINFVKEPSDFVGQTLEFLITTLEEKGKNIVVSRRALLARQLEKARKEFYENLKVGSVMDGRVTRIMPYGVFVKLSDGVEGMVHVSELSWSKVAKPEDAVKIGDTVRVKIMGIEPDRKPGMKKISLSMKQLTDNPWDSVHRQFREGERVLGTVTRCTGFGAFVEVAPGIEGLVHISEMSYTKRVLKPEDIVKSGETVSVIIKEIDADKRRLSLSIRDAVGDPWLDVEEKFAVGQSLEGVLEKKEKFGFFVTLAPGITGLVPKSKISQSQKSSETEKLKEGDAMPVIIEAIDTGKRKITLVPGNTADERNWQKFAGDDGSAIGSLGEKLSQAITRKQDK
ncbi:MAG: S1 RNA-binding domain-containing protein [Desulfobacterales bacterium]